MRDETAIDGEGVNGKGYCLLQASDGNGLEGERLGAAAVFPWLIERQAGCHRLVAYGLDYDVCNWLRGLPEKALKRLAEKGHTWVDVGGTTYSVTYRCGHSFAVSRIEPGTGGIHNGFARVLDARQWCAGPMVDAAERWDCCSAEVAGKMRAMKAQRGSFDAADLNEVRNYNGLECLATEELWRALDEFLSECNLPRPAIQMPGAVASTLMRRNRVPLMPEVPVGVTYAASKAFRGGRIQTVKFGRFGACSHLDMRSAYGWALTWLPPIPTQWRRVETWRPEDAWLSQLGVWDVEWDVPSDWDGIRPFSASGSQGRFPARGRGWFWSPMAAAGKVALGQHCTIHGGWVPLHDTGPRQVPDGPFTYIADLFRLRQSLPAEHPGRKVLQIVIAATWGKLAQGVEPLCHQTVNGKPPYLNPIWAGLVTALVDARLYEMMQANRNRVIAAHVDGVWLEGAAEASQDTGLGSWAVENYDRLLLLSSGQYWAGDGAKVKIAQSGNGIKDVSEEEALAEWQRGGPRGWLELHGEQLQTLKQVADNGCWETLGTFQPCKIGVRFSPGKGDFIQRDENVWIYKGKDNSVEMVATPDASVPQAGADEAQSEEGVTG